MNGMPSDSFSQRVVKPAVLVVLLVLLASGLATKDSLAVRDEADIYNAQFPAAPNCNACEFYVKKLEGGGQTNLCATPAPCAPPPFPATCDFNTLQTINSAVAITGLHATNPNYPYSYYCAGLTVTSGIFTGPAAGTGFLTIYVSGGNLSFGASTTTNNNVRFIVNGAVAFPGTSVLTINNPSVLIMSNTVTIGTHVSINHTGVCNFTGGTYRGTQGDPNDLLFITTGTFGTPFGDTNQVCISAGIFSDTTITTGATSRNQFSGATYSAACPTNPSNTTNSTRLGGYNIIPAATNAIQKIDVCADPGNP